VREIFTTTSIEQNTFEWLWFYLSCDMSLDNWKTDEFTPVKLMVEYKMSEYS